MPHGDGPRVAILIGSFHATEFPYGKGGRAEYGEAGSGLVLMLPTLAEKSPASWPSRPRIAQA